MAGGAAYIAQRDKAQGLDRKQSFRLPLPSDGPILAPEFQFKPPTFYSLGTPTPASVRFLEQHIPHIVKKLHTTAGVIPWRIYLRLSCSLWSSVEVVDSVASYTPRGRRGTSG